MQCTEEHSWTEKHNVFEFRAYKVNGNTDVRARENDNFRVEAPAGYYSVGENYQFEFIEV